MYWSMMMSIWRIPHMSSMIIQGQFATRHVLLWMLPLQMVASRTCLASAIPPPSKILTWFGQILPRWVDNCKSDGASPHTDNKGVVGYFQSDLDIWDVFSLAIADQHLIKGSILHRELTSWTGAARQGNVNNIPAGTSVSDDGHRQGLLHIDIPVH